MNIWFFLFFVCLFGYEVFTNSNSLKMNYVVYKNQLKNVQKISIHILFDIIIKR
jgi:hypothetical protein